MCGDFKWWDFIECLSKIDELVEVVSFGILVFYLVVIWRFVI